MTCTLTLALFLSSVTAAPPPPTVSPFVAGYDRFSQETSEGQQVGGALLISELSCTACHADDDPHLKPKRGPRLDGVALRLQRDWMLRYLADPQAIKPGTTMPNILHGLAADETDRVLHSLVAFLSTQRKPFPELAVDRRQSYRLRVLEKGKSRSRPDALPPSWLCRVSRSGR